MGSHCFVSKTSLSYSIGGLGRHISGLSADEISVEEVTGAIDDILRRLRRQQRNKRMNRMRKRNRSPRTDPMVMYFLFNEMSKMTGKFVLVANFAVCLVIA